MNLCSLFCQKSERKRRNTIYKYDETLSFNGNSELFLSVHIFSSLFLHLEWIAKTLRMMRKVNKPVVCLSTIFSFIIYKSQTAVAKLMSFSSAGLRATTTLLLYLPLESSRTEVTPQKIACSGPFNSVFPQIAVALVRW